MPAEDSKTMQFSKRDLMSFLYYAIIVAIATFIPLIPDVTNWLVVQGINSLVAVYIMSVVGILLKKLLTDYSKK